jgi:sugar (pentulose or hexulose) kinase
MLRWLRDFTGRDYAGLEALAADAPLGARGTLVIASNPEWGEHDWAHVPPISLVGLGPDHTVGDIARAVLESSAHAVACNLARLDSLGSDPAVAHVTLTGGGARSAFAAQLLANVLGRRVVVPAVDDPAALGGALLVAGLDRPGVLPAERVYEADPEQHAAYAPHTRRYAEVFARLRGAALGPA